MSGILDLLGPLANAATGAAGSYENAEGNAQALKRESIVQAMMLARQQRLDAIDAALKTGQTAEAYGRGHEAQRAADALHLGDPQYASAMGAVHGAETQAAVPFEEQLEGYKGGIARSNELAGINARGAIDTNIANIGQSGQNSRQANQQLFEGGQLNRNLAGQLANKTAETAQTQSGEIVPSIMKHIHGIGNINLNASPILPNTNVTQPIAPVLPTKGLFDDVPNSNPQPQ